MHRLTKYLADIKVESKGNSISALDLFCEQARKDFAVDANALERATIKMNEFNSAISFEKLSYEELLYYSYLYANYKIVQEIIKPELSKKVMIAN